ncbi:UNVERIFIED_CONTAM: Pentatricopeptide repeat-containing protein, chloroplastic [Sesamum latifolium]|uniref:Pentatricopeptide repeat-containing protein, chloroplastic n=1 Tax=Sesamum latifolium TaxID=2727402 RepID=A0AAW2UHU3_9LAMI
MVSNLANLRGLTFIESKAAHALLLRRGVIYFDIYATNNLLDAYSKCSRMGYAFKLFEEIPLRNVVTWNLMVLGCGNNFLFDDAWRIYCRMHNMGVDLFARRCDAIKQFRLMPVRIVVSWTAIISDFVQKGDSASALRVLKGMRKTGEEINTFTVSSAVDLSEIAFAEAQELKQVGVWANMISAFVHSGNYEKSNHSVSKNAKRRETSTRYALKVGMVSEVSVGSSVFTMYSKCGDLEESLKAFEQLEKKDNLGREIPGFALLCGFAEHTIIDDALLNMYSKCGDLSSAKIVFHAIPYNNQVSWPSLISEFAQMGYFEEALQLFHDMLLSGITVDAFTISSVLGALAIVITPGIATLLHAYIIRKVSWTTMITSYAHHRKGLEALQLFDLMKRSGIELDDVTFAGVLFACSHAGRLEAAQRFIVNMPIEPNTLVWETLLVACKVHGNHELGKLAAEKIKELQPCGAGAYVSVSNIWAEAGEWEHDLKIRGSMKEMGVRKKEPRWSFI